MRAEHTLDARRKRSIDLDLETLDSITARRSDLKDASGVCGPVSTYSSQQLCHRWYRSVLAFSDHVARRFIETVPDAETVLDPFVGTGTTCVEAKFLGRNSIGIDAVPFFVLATRVKTDWSPDAASLQAVAGEVLETARKGARWLSQSIPEDATWSDLTPRAWELWGEYLKLPSVAPVRFLSPRVYVESTLLREAIVELAPFELRSHLQLCATKSLVRGSRVGFGPEIGFGIPPADFDTFRFFWKNVEEMACDLRVLNDVRAPRTRVVLADSRDLSENLANDSVDLVVTSPPYPVDKDYTRQARIELVFLSQVKSLGDLRAIKTNMLRASTRQIYSGDNDSRFVEGLPEIRRIVSRIQARTSRDSDTSGFAKMYPRLVEEYFGGLYRHLTGLRPKLRRRARCIYVLGDSRSFKRVYIRTPEIFGRLARMAGYEVTGMQLLRIRRSTTLRKPLREVAVFLRAHRDS